MTDRLFQQLAASAGEGAKHDISSGLLGYLAGGAFAMGATVAYNGQITHHDAGNIRLDGLGRDQETATRQLAAIEGNTMRSLTEADTFPIASITKTFVAAGIVQLAAEGKLSLDDRLHEKAGQWSERLRALYPDAPEEKFRDFEKLLTQSTHPQATIGDLLKHHSGLAGKGAQNERGPRVHVDFSQSPAASEGALGFLKPQAGMPVHDRGTFDYSNAGYVLAQLISEAASGEAFRSVMETRILKPMQLEHTRVTFAPQDVPNGAGCMVSTREDLLTFMSALAQNPAYAPMLPSSGKEGIGLQSYDIDGRTFIGHTGGGGIAESAVLVDAQSPANGFSTVKVVPARTLAMHSETGQNPAITQMAGEGKLESIRDFAKQILIDAIRLSR